MASTPTSTSQSWAAASNEFAAQWTQPSDIFSVLLIVGGDVVQLALASVTGGSPLTPIAFSFGWVAYAISAVLSAVGDNRLMPSAPEVSIKLFNLHSGYQRTNQSWLLGRLFKTYDYWITPEMKALSKQERSSALCIAVYKWSQDGKPGVPTRDLVWWSAFGISIMQLGIAAIPFGLYDDWSIFLVTACGTILCYVSASIPQWRSEKWHARTAKKDIALTAGNGTQHVVVILGADGALDLEDLAGGRGSDLLSTRLSTMILAVLWLVLLISCTGIKTNTWYLLAVGSLGMLHNIVVAGAPRLPAALGLPIEPVMTSTGAGNLEETPEVYASQKVMWTLMELEEKYKGFGDALVKEFFPGKLRGWEITWWEPTTSLEQKRQLLQQAKEDERQKRLQKVTEASKVAIYPV